MIRALFMIAIAGFVLSLASFAAALAIGGPDVVARTVFSHSWGWDSDDGWDSRRDDRQASGPTVTREIAWSGNSEVEFDIPADITFTQAEGPAKLVVTGPQEAVQDVEVRHERVRFNHHGWRGARLTVVMTAPDVTSFSLNGSQQLDIRNYRQEHLSLDVNGSGDVTAQGQASDVAVEISGSGHTDLSQFTVAAAEVQISGAGEATVGPTRRADLSISGSGNINLLSRPEQMETNISGSGSIRQGKAEQAEQPAATPGKKL